MIHTGPLESEMVNEILEFNPGLSRDDIRIYANQKRRILKIMIMRSAFDPESVAEVFSRHLMGVGTVGDMACVWEHPLTGVKFSYKIVRGWVH